MTGVLLEFKEFVRLMHKEVHENIKYICDIMLYVIPLMTLLIMYYFLFLFLGEVLSMIEFNKFTIILMLATISSLIIGGGIQVVTSKMASDSQYLKVKDKILLKDGIKIGIFYVIFLSFLLAIIFFLNIRIVLPFTRVDVIYFYLILTLLSCSWILMTPFWVVKKFKYPAISLTIAYFLIFFLSLSLSISFAFGYDGAVVGYILGIGILLLLLFFFTIKLFGTSGWIENWEKLILSSPKLIKEQFWPVLFGTLYFLVIFLDKILIWLFEGVKVCQGTFAINSTYDTASFIGLLPVTLGVTIIIYFWRVTEPLLKNLYKGTLEEINRRAERIVMLYKKCLVGSILLPTFIFFLITLAIFEFPNKNVTMINVLIITCVGSIFFSGLAFNFAFLSIMREERISALSMLVVCGMEGIIIVFGLPYNILFAPIGFFIAMLTGFIISLLVVRSKLKNFTYNMFSSLL